MTNPRTNKTRKTTNKTFATIAAVPASPPKPNAAAIKAITKNVKAQPNIIFSSSFNLDFREHEHRDLCERNLEESDYRAECELSDRYLSQKREKSRLCRWHY
ncbi:hypothetical protein RB10951 [Rhodopirellula baltica SH 1]|uniref:Uncharacterized protein n=1 Tax=Rhodopirellula baltica (strain DSM 10527 / NCIMB 13988 / SH1) TaxID=243090 RepID=Q7UJZ8_RHOBA|nr:hypothetical protein RB10951 [Rhodopirellula baltica SH 1]